MTAPRSAKKDYDKGGGKRGDKGKSTGMCPKKKSRKTNVAGLFEMKKKTWKKEGGR